MQTNTSFIKTIKTAKSIRDTMTGNSGKAVHSGYSLTAHSGKQWQRVTNKRELTITNN